MAVAVAHGESSKGDNFARTRRWGTQDPPFFTGSRTIVPPCSLFPVPCLGAHSHPAGMRCFLEKYGQPLLEVSITSTSDLLSCKAVRCKRGLHIFWRSVK